MHRKILSFPLLLGLLVLPLSVQGDTLVGIWESSIIDEGVTGTARLTFRVDGTFEVSQVAQTEDGYLRAPKIFEEDDDLSAADAEALNQIFREAWPEIPLETASFHGSGTYATAGDSLWLDWADVDISYDDRDFTEFNIEFFVQFTLNWEALHRAAEGRDFPEEEYSALEQELEQKYAAEFPDVLNSEALLATLNQVPPGTYAIEGEGETLFLEGPFSEAGPWFPEGQTLLDGETLPLKSGTRAKPLAYHRIDPATAVARTTWGGLKATLAP